MNGNYSTGVNGAPAGIEYLPLEEGEVVELSLLLSGRQAAALEAAARQRGLTTGEMARHLIRSFLRQSAAPGGRPRP